MNQLRRVEELLAERATQGLESDASAELEGLLAAGPEEEEDGFDLAAAAIHLALLPGIEPMPQRVRDAVLDRSRPVPEAGGAGATELAPPADFSAARERRLPPATSTGNRWSPWLVAAAALVLALVGWWPRLAGDSAPESDEVAALESLEQASDVVRWQWAGTEDPAVGRVGGEVVWSGSEQRGFMRIRGLAANDPSSEQYQLWIFDRAQDERFPVDGGVFDVARGDEVVIPIDAKIRVDEPYLFAITVEEPGGVVVSSRERIVLLAQA